MKAANLSLETAREFYKQGGPAKQFALDNYTEKELTQKVLPKTWEELEHVSGYFINTRSELETGHLTAGKANKNVFATAEQAQAAIALAQLSQLKEAYCDGWVPDWQKSPEMKYVIFFSGDDPFVDSVGKRHHFLAFPTSELRDLFLKNFRDLIWIAKPLMS